MMTMAFRMYKKTFHGLKAKCFLSQQGHDVECRPANKNSIVKLSMLNIDLGKQIHVICV